MHKGGTYQSIAYKITVIAYLGIAIAHAVDFAHPLAFQSIAFGLLGMVTLAVAITHLRQD